MNARTTLRRILAAYRTLRYAWALRRSERLSLAWDRLRGRDPSIERTCDVLALCRSEIVRRVDALPSPNRETLIDTARDWSALPEWTA